MLVVKGDDVRLRRGPEPPLAVEGFYQCRARSRTRLLGSKDDDVTLAISMPFFRRHPEPKPEQPPTGSDATPTSVAFWQQVLESDQQQLLVRCVLSDLDARGLNPRVVGDAIEIAREGGRVTLGLDNLAQLCLQEAPSRWADVVRGHFDHLPLGVPAMPASFDVIRDSLRVRLYPAEIQMGNAVRRYLTPKLTAIVVIDAPASVQGLSTLDLKRWQVTEDEAYSVALERTLLEPMPAREVVGDSRRNGFTVFHGEGFYTASHVLRLPSLLDHLPSAGAIVAIPNRHMFAVHPLRTVAAATVAVGGMLRFAADWHQRGPGSVVPDLLWWRDSGFADLPATLAADHVEFRPPDEFVSTLNALG